MLETPSLTGRHVLFLSWRDTRNPEGGGAELYLEKIAAGLVARGARVTIFAAAHAAAPPEEERDGIRFVRAGSKTSVYLAGMIRLLRGRFGPVDVVVDVQNGLPFFSRLVTRAPVVVLVHHVHREQWPVVYPGRAGQVGWWIERWLAPRVYRRCQYVAVSHATKAELAELGVAPERVAVVHNGTEPLLAASVGKAPTPTVAVVGRLVPHKQVEHAVDAVLKLRPEFPDLVLHVVGDGWWDANLREYVAERGAHDVVRFEGHVSEQRKHELYGRAWVLALPSLKEGWGLVIGEAGMHRTPTVAYHAAGGTQESVQHDYSGILVDDEEEFTAALGRLLRDTRLRERLGVGAEDRSRIFSWEHAQAAFGRVLESALAGELVETRDQG